MNQSQIDAVEETWDFVVLNSADAGRIFYSKLFELDPSLRALFKDNIDEQARKLVSLITFIVHKLDNLDTVINDVISLGKRHAAYKVKAEHFATVGQALLWTLEKSLQDRWTQETKLAWIEVYTILSKTMIQAMNEREAELNAKPR
jgi:hemoglobin-like flavoprotein